MNELTTFRWSFEEDVHNYAAADINAIGVWRQKLSDYGEEKGIELLSEYGMQVSNLLWAGGFTGRVANILIRTPTMTSRPSPITCTRIMVGESMRMGVHTSGWTGSST